MTRFLIPVSFVTTSSTSLTSASLTTSLVPQTTSTTTSLNATALVLKDCTSGALAFFNGVRVPAALIAGSSLAAMFSLVGKYRQERKTKSEKIVLRIFHACVLFAFLLSVTTVVSSTTASTTLLMGRFDPQATSVYYFLKREMNFEFVLTRWCFLMGVLNFLTAVGGRALLEFQLMTPERLIERSILITAFVAMIGHQMSVINCSLNCWPNLAGMTVDLFQMAIIRAWKGNMTAAVAIASAVASVSMVLYTIAKEVRQDNDVEDETTPVKAPATT